MRASQVISSSIQLLFATFLMGAGGLCCAVAYSDSLKEIVIECVKSNNYWIALGIVTLGCSIILFTAFFYLYRRQFYRFSMGGDGKIAIHTETIESLVLLELQKIYPGKPLCCDVEIHQSSKGKKQLIEIKTDLPENFLENEGELLNSIESKLQILFNKQLGYHHEFILNVSFNP